MSPSSETNKVLSTEVIAAVPALKFCRLDDHTPYFSLVKTKDPESSGVFSIDVTVNFDVDQVNFEQFSSNFALAGVVNSTKATEGQIRFAAVAIDGVSSHEPLFTIKMNDLDPLEHFTVSLSNLFIHGVSLNGSTFLIA